jgi:hypothetical protein
MTNFLVQALAAAGAIFLFGAVLVLMKIKK